MFLSPNIQKISRAVLSAGLAATFAANLGCTQEAAKVKTVRAEDRLQVSGRVESAARQPFGGAVLTIDGLDGIRGESRADGTWNLTLTADDLVRINARVASADFRIYATEFGAAGLTVSAGVSVAMDARDRGVRAIDPIILDRTASLTGIVWVQRQGQRPQPVEGAKLRIGKSETSTLVDGSFTISGIPAGRTTLSISTPGLEGITRELSFAPGEAKRLDAPILLFPANAVAGYIQILPTTNIDELVAISRPFLRSFRVLPSPHAKLIRYATDSKKFEGEPAAATGWIPVQEIMDHDFPGNGGATLFVQFADANKSRFSEIHQLTVTVDLFAASRGITINDGSGVTRSRVITVNVDVPAAATRMKIADTEDRLDNAEWQNARPAVNFVLPLRPDTTNGQILANGLREVYLQFSDALGRASQVYSSTVYLEVFPRGNDAFRINDGAPTSIFHTVRLSINVPATAHKLRVFELAPSSGRSGGGGFGGGGSSGSGSSINTISRDTSDLWFDPRPELFYNFSSTGPKILYLQFKDIDNAVSPTYQQLIRLDVDQASPIGFDILDGPVALSRQLSLDLRFPPHVKEYRVFEDSEQSTSWRAIERFASYITDGFGARTISVQYRTVDGETLAVITRDVYVEPFPAGTYGFDFDPTQVEIIGGSTRLTRSPWVRLLITPPPGARDFAAVQDVVGSSFWSQFNDWMPLNLDANGIPQPIIHDLQLTPFVGTKTITVKFRAEFGVISPNITQLIRLDPFYAPPTTVRINNGDATTNSPDATVTFTFGNLPAGHQIQYRLATSDLGVDLAPWQVVVGPEAPVTLPAAPGVHRVYVQFRMGSIESGLFSDTIELVP